MLKPVRHMHELKHSCTFMHQVVRAGACSISGEQCQWKASTGTGNAAEQLQAGGLHLEGPQLSAAWLKGPSRALTWLASMRTEAQVAAHVCRRAVGSAGNVSRNCGRTGQQEWS